MSKKINAPTFDKNASLALKGIAIILMMIHHNFRVASLFSSYSVSFVPFTQESIVAFAYSCKICVSIFAFISGYGLYLSYIRANTNATQWILYRYIKTFSGYWFIWIGSAIICQIINGRTTFMLFRDGLAKGIIYTAINFLGLHNLFATPSINGTWWYMSAAAVFILLIPVLYRFKDNLLLVIIWVIAFIRVINGDNYFPGGNSVYAFLTPFISGTLFARHNVFETIMNIGKNNLQIKMYKAIFELCFIIFFYLLYAKIPMESFWEFHFGLFPLFVIAFCVEFVIPFRHLQNVLIFLGRHSMNIFMVHTFIRGYYLSDLTYSWRHFLLITLFLLLTSIGISICIEYAKKILKYNNCITRMIQLLNSI